MSEGGGGVPLAEISGLDAEMSADFEGLFGEFVAFVNALEVGGGVDELLEPVAIEASALQTA